MAGRRLRSDIGRYNNLASGGNTFSFAARAVRRILAQLLRTVKCSSADLYSHKMTDIRGVSCLAKTIARNSERGCYENKNAVDGDKLSFSTYVKKVTSKKCIHFLKIQTDTD